MALPATALKQASFPEVYERWLAGPLFRPWAETILDDAGVSAGDRVLDIACGTGVVARVAKDRLGATGQVVGIDINPEMLAVARAVAPGIDWREGNAAALPLREGEAFDVVVCHQGLQFFPDKPAAAAQMRRALAKGGRLAVATWRPDSESPLLLELRRIAERHLGAITDMRHSFGEAAPVEALLREAGFHDVRSRTLSRTIRFEPDAPFVRLNTVALVGMSAGAKTLSDDARTRVVEAIVNDSAPLLQRYADGAGIAFTISANLATATG